MAGIEWYPAVSFYFDVQFEGIENPGDRQFMEVSGLEMGLEFAEVPEGSNNLPLPLKRVFKNLILKRGFFKDSQLAPWLKNAIDKFIIEHKDIHINLLDEKGLPMATWEFQSAYPINWSISDLNSMENTIVVETIEIGFKSMTRIL